jgi:hypothetical protein
MDFELGQKIIIERAYELDKTRIGGGLFMKRNMLFRGKLKPRIIGDFSMLGFHKHGLIFKKSLAVSIEPHEYITVVGQFMRSQRLPTFLELYADNRFFIGNEDLEKESIGFRACLYSAHG